MLDVRDAKLRPLAFDGNFGLEREALRVTEDGHTEELCWISPDEPTRYYPEFLRTELSHPSNGVKFFSTDDR